MKRIGILTMCLLVLLALPAQAATVVELVARVVGGNVVHIAHCHRQVGVPHVGANLVQPVRAYREGPVGVSEVVESHALEFGSLQCLPETPPQR